MITAADAPHPSSRALIYCVVDSSFHAIARLFLRLLQSSYPDHPDVFLHTIDLDPAQIRQLESPPRIRCARVQLNEFDGFPLIAAHGCTSPQSLYGRFHIWKDGFLEYDNVIYLDLDAVVLGSLECLCKSHDFFIVTDVYAAGSGPGDAVVRDPTDAALKRLLAEDNISLPQIAANGGMFVVPRRYRTRAHFNEILRLGHRYRPHLRWADQSLLNLWLSSHAIPISPALQYNYQYSLLRPWCISPDVRIVHLNGMMSPIRRAVMWIALHTRRIDVHLILFSMLCFVWNAIGDWVVASMLRRR